MNKSLLSNVISQYNDGRDACQQILKRYNTCHIEGWNMTRTIALLTDFGTTDTYVGVMKAVMSRICPDAHFIDITHEIARQNVQQGAFTLLRTYRYFPPGTVFLVVVDPGVGTVRKAIAAQVGDYTFVAPDNGVLSYVLAEYEDARVVELSNPAYQLSPVSSTFHGRDIIAPAAAHLASGISIEQFGSPLPDYVRRDFPQVEISAREIRGHVLFSDHFGNIITSIGELTWPSADHITLISRAHPSNSVTFSAQQAAITVNGHTLSSIRRTYSEVNMGDFLVIADSSGYLEIAVNQGSAAHQLSVEPGAPVILQIG
jgi:S-adenosylmethionine hydrolase